MMAHKKGLDGTCLKPTMEECYNEVKKAIPELTIDASLRKQIELDKVNKEKEELEKTHVAKDEVKEMISSTVRSEIEKLILKSD